MHCGGALEDLFAASYSVGPSRCDLSFQIMRASFFCQTNKWQSSQLLARLLLAMSVAFVLRAGEVTIAEGGGRRRCHIFEQ